MKALVISGGGSKGAFAGGIAEFLINEAKREYDLFLGTSTGSLLVPLLSIGEIEKIKAIYTTVTQDDIFNVHPFIVKKRNGVYKTSINHLGILGMFLRGRKTFGESLNLKELICKILTEEDFERIRSSGNEVVVTVSNLSYNRVEYKSSKNCTYDDFCEWMWASANLVPFMSLLSKEDCEYADGGIGNTVPLMHAINMGATDIDVIVLQSEKPKEKRKPIRNSFETITRVFDFMLDQIEVDDIMIGKLEGLQQKVKINFYYPPEDLTANSLIFDEQQMKAWWDYGTRYARGLDPVCRTLSTSPQI